MFDLAGGFVLAALPALPLLYWLRRMKNSRSGESQPKSNGFVGKGLLLGFAAVAPAAVLEYFLAPLSEPWGSVGNRLVGAFCVAAFVEEGVKFAFLRIWLRSGTAGNAMDAIAHAISISLGFAVIENFVYTWDRPELLVIRSLTAVPLHVLATGQLGFWLGIRTARKKAHDPFLLPRGGWLRGFTAAVMVHGVYDFLVLGEDFAAFFVLPLLIFSSLLLRSRLLLARRIDEELENPVDSLYRERR